VSKHKGSKSNQKELIKALEHALVLSRREAATQHDEGLRFKILLACYMREHEKETIAFDKSVIADINPAFGFSFVPLDGGIQVTLHNVVKDDPPKEAGTPAEAEPELKDGVLVIGEPKEKPEEPAPSPAEVQP
jgi:hypothetical protein